MLTCYEMDPDFVGVVPGQGGQALVPVALGQPDHLLPAQAELVGAQVVPVKDVHHAVRRQHGETDPEERNSYACISLTILQVFTSKVGLG